MVIPSLTVFGTLVLRPAVSRLANIVLGLLYALTIVAGAIGEWSYHLPASAIEVAATGGRRLLRDDPAEARSTKLHDRMKTTAPLHLAGLVRGRRAPHAVESGEVVVVERDAGGGDVLLEVNH